MAKSKAARHSERRRFLSRTRSAEAFFALDIQTGAEKLRPEDLLQRESPASVQDAFRQARKWHRENWFVEQLCQLKQGFYNYGLQVQSRRKTDAKKVAGFLEDRGQSGALYRYIDSVLSEAILQQTVISFWREEAETTPFLLLPENCRYSDAMGIEKLRVNLNYKKAELEDADRFGAPSFTQEMIRRYAGSQEILLEEQHDEYFHVLTGGLRGQGLGWPRLRRVFRTLSQNESMEVGESMLALAGRLVERTHRLGFEVKNSANAMRQAEYLWKKPRAQAIESFYTGRSGFVETTRQFDHTTEYIWVDPKYYDNRKWATIVDRLMWWGGPLAFMLMAKTPNPNLVVSFMAEVAQFRTEVARHLEYVIERGFGLAVTLHWSNRCFLDLRLFWDMMKFYTQQGPLSLTTGLETGGFDPAEEARRKKEEAKASRSDELLPLFNPHTAKGGKPGEEGAGKPRVNNQGKEKE